MSVLKSSGYGDGGSGSGSMTDDWMGIERNGGTPSGIPLLGITAGVAVVPLGGQPPVGVHGNWGDLSWVTMPKVGQGL